MGMVCKISVALACASSTVALTGRGVDQLDLEAFQEAHPRDETAMVAFSNTKITTGDGRCLFVDLLSGDFRANLNPLQVADCGTTDGQGWDVVVSGVHNNQPGTTLLVSTLTQACVSFDPRRPAGSQVHLFSCGGRAAGEGEVTDSQLFGFDGLAGPLILAPQNAGGQCLVVNGDVVDIAPCDTTNAGQGFTFGGGAAANVRAPQDVAKDCDRENEQEGGDEVDGGKADGESEEAADADEAGDGMGKGRNKSHDRGGRGGHGAQGLGRARGGGRGDRGGRGGHGHHRRRASSD